MSDLLQRLRSGTFDEYSGDEDLKMEAADEIERLTRLVWADQQNPITWRDMAEHYRKENDRLVKQSVEAIAKDKVAHLEAMLESFKSHRDEQLAEIDRLTREKAAERGLREGAVLALESERDRLRAENEQLVRQIAALRGEK